MVFGHFWQWSYENTKILRSICLHFTRQDGQDGKKWIENHTTKVTKIQKIKRQKHGMNETIVKINQTLLPCHACMVPKMAKIYLGNKESLKQV